MHQHDAPARCTSTCASTMHRPGTMINAPSHAPAPCTITSQSREMVGARKLQPQHLAILMPSRRSCTRFPVVTICRPCKSETLAEMVRAANGQCQGLTQNHDRGARPQAADCLVGAGARGRGAGGYRHASGVIETPRAGREIQCTSTDRRSDSFGLIRI